MKWYYNFEKDWNEIEEITVQQIYLRPAILDEQGDELVGKIVKVSIVALEFFMSLPDNPMKDEQAILDIYHGPLSKQDFHQEEAVLPKNEEIYLAQTYIYLRKKSFNGRELFDWVKKFFAQKRYDGEAKFVKAGGDKFVDLTTQYQIAETARKFEGKFGKEWWK